MNELQRKVSWFYWFFLHGLVVRVGLAVGITLIVAMVLIALGFRVDPSNGNLIR